MQRNREPRRKRSNQKKGPPPMFLASLPGLSLQRERVPHEKRTLAHCKIPLSGTTVSSSLSTKRNQPHFHSPTKKTSNTLWVMDEGGTGDAFCRVLFDMYYHFIHKSSKEIPVEKRNRNASQSLSIALLTIDTTKTIED